MKQKIKQNKKCVTLYLDVDDYDKLVEETNKQKISLTDWLQQAYNLKFKLDNDDLLDLFNKRIKELKNNN